MFYFTFYFTLNFQRRRKKKVICTIKIKLYAQNVFYFTFTFTDRESEKKKKIDAWIIFFFLLKCFFCCKIVRDIITLAIPGNWSFRIILILNKHISQELNLCFYISLYGRWNCLLLIYQLVGFHDWKVGYSHYEHFKYIILKH